MLEDSSEFVGLIPDSKKGRSHVKSAKGSHASNNAYMLVYTRRDPDSGKKEKQAASSTVLLPPWIQTALHEENDHFEKWNRDVNLRKVLFNFHPDPLASNLICLKNNGRRTRWGSAEKSTQKCVKSIPAFLAVHWQKVSLCPANGWPAGSVATTSSSR